MSEHGRGGRQLAGQALLEGVRADLRCGCHPRAFDQGQDGPDDLDGAAILAGIVRTVLPLIERTGVATAAEVGADTLQQRLSGELAASAAVFAHPMLISAWGTARQPK